MLLKNAYPALRTGLLSLGPCGTDFPLTPTAIPMADLLCRRVWAAAGPLPKTALLTDHLSLLIPALPALQASAILLLRRWSWLRFAATSSSRFPTATARLVSACSTARMINRLIMLGSTTAFVTAALWFAYNVRRRGRVWMWRWGNMVRRWRSMMRRWSSQMDRRMWRRRRSSRMMRCWRRHMFYRFWCRSRYMRRWSSTTSWPSRLRCRRTLQLSTRCNGASWSSRCAGRLRTPGR